MRHYAQGHTGGQGVQPHQTHVFWLILAGPFPEKCSGEVDSPALDTDPGTATC